MSDSFILKDFSRNTVLATAVSVPDLETVVHVLAKHSFFIHHTVIGAIGIKQTYILKHRLKAFHILFQLRTWQTKYFHINKNSSTLKFCKINNFLPIIYAYLRKICIIIKFSQNNLLHNLIIVIFACHFYMEIKLNNANIIPIYISISNELHAHEPCYGSWTWIGVW